MPKGGPDGGDGGRGGEVVLVCDDGLRDLQPFRRRAHFKAERGGHGQGALRHGADGLALEITVPPGTEAVLEDGTRFDLLEPGQRAVVAHGGSGGRGNKRFAGPTHQAPRFVERGIPGEEGWLTLQLRLLADVGLVGLPNVGKSSLLARLTRARPKVAGYPFTTLEPVLGTLEGAERQLVVADIPGLIEGASSGAGLGHDFLAHVERTRLLVHVLDLSPVDGSDPLVNHMTVEQELGAHDPRLATLPRVLALSKADLVAPAAAEGAVEEWRARLGDAVPVLLTSSATGQGMEELGRELFARVTARSAGQEGAAERAEPELAEHRVFRPTDRRAFRVERTSESRFRVLGAGIDRLVARYDVENEEAMAHLERRLRMIGVVRALEEQGFQPGDDVELGGVDFELDP